MNCGVWNDGGIRGWSKSPTNFEKPSKNIFVFEFYSASVTTQSKYDYHYFSKYVGYDLDWQQKWKKKGTNNRQFLQLRFILVLCYCTIKVEVYFICWSEKERHKLPVLSSQLFGKA